MGACHTNGRRVRVQGAVKPVPSWQAPHATSAASSCSIATPCVSRRPSAEFEVKLKPPPQRATLPAVRSSGESTSSSETPVRAEGKAALPPQRAAATPPSEPLRVQTSLPLSVHNDPTFNDSARQLSPAGSKLRWKRGELIGHGSHGTVFLGLDLRTGKLMAAKQVRSSTMSALRLVALRQEVSLLRSLDHPNIVRYLGTMTEGDLIYIFTEWVPGGSLAAVLKKFGRLDATLVANYAEQMLQGLNHLHSHNVIHRDVKPGNVLIDANGIVKLADFGESERLEVLDDGSVRKMRATRVLGTPYYMSPELIRGAQNASGQEADVWALGCTVLHLVTGQYPWASFKASEPTQLLTHIARAGTPPPIPSTVDGDLRDFLLRCLDPDHTKRATIAELMVHPYISASLFGDDDDAFSSCSDEESSDDEELDECKSYHSCDVLSPNADSRRFGVSEEGLRHTASPAPVVIPTVAPMSPVKPRSSVVTPSAVAMNAPASDASLPTRRSARRMRQSSNSKSTGRLPLHDMFDRSNRAAEKLFRESGLLPPAAPLA